MATYVVGTPYKAIPRFSKLMDLLNFGQPWIELGYYSEQYTVKTLSTEVSI